MFISSPEVILKLPPHHLPSPLMLQPWRLACSSRDTLCWFMCPCLYAYGSFSSDNVLYYLVCLIYSIYFYLLTLLRELPTASLSHLWPYEISTIILHIYYCHFSLLVCLLKYEFILVRNCVLFILLHYTK